MSRVDPEAVTELVMRAGRRLGFHRLGVVSAAESPRYAEFLAWLARGYAGEMQYLARSPELTARAHPRGILPNVRSVVVGALLCAGAPNRDAADERGARGRIARYARGDDYHHLLKRKLYALADSLGAAFGADIACRPCVDTAPLLERGWAERAGLGFIGKNTLLIAPGLGSHLLIGALLLSIDATPTSVNGRTGLDGARCGECRACLDACPTGAFVDAYQLDARRCISYLTIELRGPIPRALRPLVGAHVFGCDVCQDVCPFNAADHGAATSELVARDGAHTTPELVRLLEMGAAQFRRYSKKSALRRVRREQLLRNACVALGNSSGTTDAVPALRKALIDRHPLVRGHAAWALGRWGDRASLAARLGDETDAWVREEISAALAPSAPAI